MYTADAVNLWRGGSVWLSEGWGSRGNQSEIAVAFPLPSAFATFGIIINVSSSTPSSINVSVAISIAFDPMSFVCNLTLQQHTGDV